jgi:hypothetical protein
MPEYLLPFEENTIFIVQIRRFQKRPFSLAGGTVIIPRVQNTIRLWRAFLMDMQYEIQKW